MHSNMDRRTVGRKVLVAPSQQILCFTSNIFQSLSTNSNGSTLRMEDTTSFSVTINKRINVKEQLFFTFLNDNG